MDLIGHCRTCQLYWLSALCVAGCMQESAWRGVMRSLDNFFKAASNNRWCEGAWPPQLAGTRGGKRGRLIRSVYDPVRISCIVKFETWELWDQSKLEPPTLSGPCISTPLSHTHGILINPPQTVWRRRKQVHVTEWEGTQWSCGGDKEWFGCGPSQSAGDWRFTQAGGAYNWLFVAVRGMNMCVCLCLPLPG